MSSSMPLSHPRAYQRPVTSNRLPDALEALDEHAEEVQVARISSRHQRLTCSIPRYVCALEARRRTARPTTLGVKLVEHAVEVHAG